MPQPVSSNTLPVTIAEELDRLDGIAGNIGFISPESGFTLLNGLDSAYRQIMDLSPESSSRRIAETQINTTVAKLRSEADRFLRDIGGIQALQQARHKVNPPPEHAWWFLDEYVAGRRKVRGKRLLISSAIILGVLALLVILYRTFLAPDPQVVAVYTHEQAAVDLMMAGNLESALKEVEQGLAVSPEEPSLLIKRGVILDIQGKTAEAEQAFDTARRVVANDVNFLIARGQAYTYVGQAEKAYADAEQAAKLNPESAQAYMLSGMANEMLGKNADALDAYENAFDAAEKTNELELAALARTRIAFLVQGTGGGMLEQFDVTPAP